MKMPAADTYARYTEAPAAGLPLSAIERRAVHLGRADAERRLSSQPRLRCLLFSFAGLAASPPASDPRLNSLRRYGDAIRSGDPAAKGLALELRMLGLSADAIGTATALAKR